MKRRARSCRTFEIAAALWLAAALWPAAAPPAAAQARLPRIFAVEETLRGTEEQEVRWPIAVASAGEREFAVADAFGPRVSVFRKDGLSWRLDASVDLPGGPVGLAHDGRRYVASLRGEQGLLAFEGPRLLQRRIGLPGGVVPGALSARPNGSLLVYDYAGERVVVLSADGEPEGDVKIDGRVTALAATSTGGFCATIAEAATVLRYDGNGTLEAAWQLPDDGPVPAWPAGLAVEPGGDIVVVDRHSNRLLLLDVGGKPLGVGSRRGWEPGLLWFPSAIARLPDGRLIVADQGNGRLQLFRRTEADASP
jgi:hypothetical protein